MIKKVRAFNGNSGFTLIEMLIVIAVIAVLAGVVLTGVSGFRQTARDTRRIGDLRNVQNYLELFSNRCGHYPISGSTDSDCGSASGDGNLSWGELENALSGVASRLPNDPGSTEYEYGYSDGGISYVLKATLERDNSALQEDVDGTVYTIDCGTDGPDEREYCTRS